MLTKAEVAYYRRILNVTPDQLGKDPGRRGRTHGRMSTYAKGCRCTECTAAKRAKAQRERDRRAERKATGAIKHGTVSGYRAYGCRCTDCATAHRKSVQGYRRRTYAERAAS